MQIIHKKETLRALCTSWREQHCSIALVPTMGALHQGHLDLVKSALSKADKVVVTIFVNPAQFGPSEDLGTYPRQVEQDRLQLEKLKGVACLFIPQVKEMYGHDFQTFIGNEQKAKQLCGASRPKFFRGVLTIVAKLFNVVQPHYAFFGRKDFQQLAIVRQLVRDLDYPIEIVGVETARENDGLACSSRNQRLSETERKGATQIFAALQAARRECQTGITQVDRLEAFVKQHLEDIPNFEIDYCQIRTTHSLTRCENTSDTSTVLLVAGQLGGTRLIDNIELN